MAEILISPPFIALPSFVYGSDRPVRETLTLSNPSTAPCDVTLSADEPLSLAASSVDFRLVSDGGEEVHAGDDVLPDSCFAGLLMMEGANAAGMDAWDSPELLALSQGGTSFRASIPANGELSVTVTFRPLFASPYQAAGEASGKAPSSHGGAAQSSASKSALKPGGGGGAAGDGDMRYTMKRFYGSLLLSQACAGRVAEASVPVSGWSCESHVYTDTTDLVFDRCAPGKRYVKDFSVWNASECETRFQLSLGDPTRGDSFQVFDYDTGIPILGETVHLPPLANYRVMLAFQASEKDVTTESAARTPVWLAIENMLDARNVTYVRVLTFTTSKLAGAGLDFSCGDKIHFGDCYLFEPVWRDIKMRNKLLGPVRITLSSTLQDQVSFEVITEGHNEPAENAGGDSAYQDQEEDEPKRGNPAPLADADESEDDEDSTSDGDEGAGRGRRVVHRRSKNRKATKRLFKTERLDFRPEETRCLRVWYTPKRSPSTQDPGRLQRRTFQLVFRQSNAETRLIAAEAQACESVVTLGGSELNLGDCDVLHEFHSSVTLYNLSDLPAVMKANCESKCITTAASVIKIEPRQSFDLKILFRPLTLNPMYMRQIEFVNSFNRRSGRVAVSVRANNVDSKCISLHAVFYKVLDNSSQLTNEVPFGRTAANYPALRAFKIANVSSQVLVLGFDETPGIATFVPIWNVKRQPETLTTRPSFSSGVDSLSRKSSTSQAVKSGPSNVEAELVGPSPRLISTFLEPVSRTLMSLLDAETLVSLHGIDQAPLNLNDTSSSTRLLSNVRPKSSSSVDSCDFADFVRNLEPVSELPPPRVCLWEDSLLSAPEEVRAELMQQWTDVDFVPLSLVANVLSGMEEESRWADEQLRPGVQLIRHVQSRALVRSNLMSLAPGEESVVVVALTTGDSSVNRRPFSTSLKVQLVEYDASRLERRAKACAWRGAMFAETSFEHPPPREVSLYVQVCRSPVKIRPLRILNFGALTVGMQRHRHFCIDNSDSNACLVFRIEKTRSVASGDVRLGNGYDSGRLGVVRPFSVATIPFIFRPSLPGQFLEVVRVVNVMDISATRNLTVKASVGKRSNFHVLPLGPTDFGTISYGKESSHVLKFEVHNDTDKPRRFTVKVIDRRRSSSAVPQPKVLLSVVPPPAGTGSEPNCPGKIVDKEELAAKLEKLSIYLKKGKAAKAEELRREVVEMESRLNQPAPDLNSPTESFDRAMSGDHIAFPDSPARPISGERLARPRRVSENVCNFVVLENGMTTIEVSLLIGKGGELPKAFTGIDLQPAHHVRTLSRGSHSFGDSFVDGFVIGPDAVERQGLASAGFANMTLGIFETKNRDLCHSINCSTFVTALIPRSESTLDTSQLFFPRNEGSSASSLAPAAAVPTLVKAMNPLNAMQLPLNADSVETSAAPPRVAFGNLQVGVAARRPIQIRNTSQSHARYEFLIQEAAEDAFALRAGVPTALPMKQRSSIFISGLEQPVAPGEVHTFFISFIALSPGPHSKMLVLRSISEDCEAHHVVLSAFCVRGNVVSLRSALPSLSSVSLTDAGIDDLLDSQLDLGSGVVDPSREYAIVCQVHCVSLVDVDVVVSVRSNLSFQVMVFADLELTVPAEGVLIPARKSTPLWIAVSPRLRKSEIRDGVSKKLVGGLQLVAKSADNLRLGESTVRFSGTVGSSHFVVSPAFVDLGRVKLSPDGTVTLSGRCRLENTSVGNEAQFALVSSSPNLCVISKASGILRPRGPSGVASSFKTVEASHAHDVVFSLFANQTGLRTEHLIVQNILAPSLSYSLPVRVFVDPGVFLSSIRSLRLSAPGGGIEPKQCFVYLTPSTNDNWEIVNGGQHIWSVFPQTQLSYDTPVSISPSSNLLLEVRPTGSEQQPANPEEIDVGLGGVGGGDALYRICGPSVSLVDSLCEDGGVPRLEFGIFPLNPLSLKAKEQAALQRGDTVSATGGVLLCDSLDMDRGLHSLDLTFTYCVSRLGFISSPGIHGDVAAVKGGNGAHATVTTFVSDLGSFGHCNAWRDEIVVMSVMNESAAPVEFGFDSLPPGFAIERIGDAGSPDAEPSDSGFAWFDLEAGGCLTVKLRISTKTFLDCANGGSSPGRMSETIIVTNSMNPRGGLIWKVEGRLTSPRLSFEGLGKRSRPDGRLVLSLPDLLIPGNSASSESFRVKNVSDTCCVLQVGFDKTFTGNGSPDPALEALLQLVDVDIFEHVSGVDLRDAKLNPGEDLVVRVSLVGRGNADESVLAASVFGKSDRIDRVIGSVSFGCVSDVVEVRAVCRKGQALGVQPNELFFSGFLSRDSYRDDSLFRSDVNSQVATVSNCYGQTDVQVCLKMADMPSALTPVVSPRMAWIEAGSSVDILIGFSKNSSTRSAVYGSGSLLVCDMTGLADRGGVSSPPPTLDPVATIAVHISNEYLHPASADEESEKTKPKLAGSAISGAPDLPSEAKSTGLSGSEPVDRSPSLKSDCSGVPSPQVASDNWNYDTPVPSMSQTELPPSSFSSGGGEQPGRVKSDAPSSGSPGFPPRAMSGFSEAGLCLKGCSQVTGDPNRFELVCGQFSVSSEAYVRRITLENRTRLPVEYKCIRIRPQGSIAGTGDSYQLDEAWLNISRSGGILAPTGERGDSQVLVLTMERRTVDVFSAYLLLESGNGEDVKVIRVGMEVCADGETPGVADSYFSVICDGRGKDSWFIDYSSCIFDKLYRHRSFVLFNRSGVTLEFMLSSDLPESARSEVTFSLNNSVLRKTTRIMVKPNEQRRVFLLYRPVLEKTASVDPGAEIERVFNVRVTCRLVSAHQKNITIFSTCRRPSLDCDTADLLFSSVTPASGSPALGLETSLKPEFATLSIRNVTPQIPLLFCIRNQTRFFEIDCDDDITLSAADGNCMRSIVVRPNVARIREHAQHLLSNSIDEHISVYNRQFPREFYWIRLRLAVGGTASGEFSTVTHKRAFEFAALEGKNFIRSPTPHHLPPDVRRQRALSNSPVSYLSFERYYCQVFESVCSFLVPFSAW